MTPLGLILSFENSTRCCRPGALRAARFPPIECACLCHLLRVPLPPPPLLLLLLLLLLLRRASGRSTSRWLSAASTSSAPCSSPTTAPRTPPAPPWSWPGASAGTPQRCRAGKGGALEPSGARVPLRSSGGRGCGRRAPPRCAALAASFLSLVLRVDATRFSQEPVRKAQSVLRG